MDSPARVNILRSSRTKLIPFVIVLSAFTMPMTLISAMLIPVSLMKSNRFALSELLAELVIYSATAFMMWGVVHNARRIINPDELELSYEGVRITQLGKTSRYCWNDLGPPYVARRSPKSMAREIRMRLLPSKWRNLKIFAEQYEHSVDDMLIAINNAKNGIFEQVPPEPSLASYRYFAIPMALITAGALPALCAYLSWSAGS